MYNIDLFKAIGHFYNHYRYLYHDLRYFLFSFGISEVAEEPKSIHSFTIGVRVIGSVERIEKHIIIKDISIRNRTYL